LPDASRDFDQELEDLIRSAQQDRRKKSAAATASQAEKKKYLSTSQSVRTKEENTAFCASLQEADAIDEVWLLTAEEAEAELSGL
jgi:hypothetical protein